MTTNDGPMFLAHHFYNTCGIEDRCLAVTRKVIFDGFDILGTELFLSDWFGHSNRNNFRGREGYARNVAIFDFLRVVAHNLFNDEVTVLIAAMRYLLALNDVPNSINAAHRSEGGRV